MAVAHVPENERITTQVLTYVVGCYTNVCMHREYFRTDDLLNFKSEKTSCHCCSVNHVDAAGDALLCDKHVLTRCISLWFGSMEHFDALVRSTVGECLTQQLSKDFRGYWSCVMATVPAVWVAADVAAFQWLRLGSFQPEVARVVGRILAWMLGVQPCLLFFSLRAARVFRRRRRYEAVVNLLILCGPLTAFVAANQMEKFYLGLVNRLPEEHRLPYYATILLGLTWLPVAALLYRYIGVHPRKAQPVDDEISLDGHMLPRPPAATVGAALEGHTLEGHTSPVESKTILSL
ncbi:unnamed protein product [Symbiodinium natans]|uniref:Uncharacterized protein n=1 Tax=Symbiodinium natans TaxID=878477 RepID=A0A812TBL6_9DINO|nr:unnamed protein product [Symbiodinium natans]